MEKISSPTAILIGSIIISLAILISNGTLDLKGIRKAGNSPAVTTTTQQPSQNNSEDQPTVTLDQVKSAFNKAQVKFGTGSEKLVVVEMSDPSCPYCQIAAGKNPELNKQAGSRFMLVADGGTYVAPVPELKKLVDQKKAAFAYLYYPGHGNGEMGTKAMYCAFEKGKFWEVHDLLMSSKGYDLLNNTVKNDKSQSGALADFLQPAMDSAAMKQCLESGKYDSRIQEDMSQANGLGVQGTPGFYLNEKMFGGAYSYTDMESTVNSVIQ